MKKIILIIISLSVICHSSPDFYLGIPIQTITLDGKSKYDNLFAFTIGTSKTVRISKYFNGVYDGACLSAHIDYSAWSIPFFGGRGVGSSYSSGISGLFNISNFVDVGAGIAILGLVDHNQKILAYSSKFSSGYTLSANFHGKESKAGLNFRFLISELYNKELYTNFSVALVLYVDNMSKQHKPVKN
ncbi:MAG: hypothetical protein JNL74_19335 [Fibrobacteres bacterium]|nr:hypothetical protein [Fibrobacterota bacterium]